MRYSKLLKKRFIVKDNGGVWFEDNIEYTRDEILLLKGAGNDCIESVHNCKSVFGGKVVEDVWTV
uniref:Uncharacterized protein n=1 Tax=viral metagenome TaxID=1070528 RepID=A0A6M3M612_9ZZZZ